MEFVFSGFKKRKIKHIEREAKKDKYKIVVHILELNNENSKRGKGTEYREMER